MGGRAGRWRPARAWALALLLGGCLPTPPGQNRLLLPWRERPDHFHWVVCVGPAVNVWSDPPPGVADVFLGLRVGLFLATAGKHHIDEADADSSVVKYVARHTYFRSGLPIVPDSLFISPLAPATGMNVFGVGFRPTSFGMHPAGGFLRFGFSGGWVVTYAYIQTTSPAASETHFLRPGLDVRGDFEIDWNGALFLGLGWNSMFHLPQTLGASFDAVNAAGPQLWHIGQGYLLFNIRLFDEGITEP